MHPAFIAAFIISSALAAQAPDLSGTWLSDSNGSTKWILDQQPGEIHVQELEADKVETDFTCPLNGNDCKVKKSHHAETIMMYFNGDKLVEIRQHGSDTTKQRLTVSADGKTLTVETVPLSNTQKEAKETFRRS